MKPGINECDTPNDDYKMRGSMSWALWFVVDIVTCIKRVSDVC